jgi:hypothetical protein
VATRLPNRSKEHKTKKQLLLAMPRREAAGVLIIAVLILAITVARYWHNIAWSAR